MKTHLNVLSQIAYAPGMNEPTEEAGPRQKAAETKRRRTREAIINGTLDLFGQLDRGDFTRDQIIAEAGVGAATLYNHFPTKYAVLRAAYERLLAPVTEPVKTLYGQADYKPTDRVDEVVRFLYAVTKVSYDHRALTNAMIRAYFEVPPEHKVYASYLERSGQLSGMIAGPLHQIASGDPFIPAGTLAFIDSLRLDYSRVVYHTDALLFDFYHLDYSLKSRGDVEISGTAPHHVTQRVLDQLLPSIMPTFYEHEVSRDLQARLSIIRRQVDESLARQS